MSKKKKLDEAETFEVWMLKTNGEWYQIQEDGNAIFVGRNRALLIAQSRSQGQDVVETMVISRRPVASFNGEAISLKHRIRPVEKKEEQTHVEPEVHGARPAASDAPATGDQHVRQADLA